MASSTHWCHVRGGKAKAIVLPGEFHDFDAAYHKEYWPQAQNPVACTRMISATEVTPEKTGEKFPNNADGYRKMLNKCVALGPYFRLLKGYP
jgi:hypothetical protein